MVQIKAQMVKELREKTGLPLMECKKALSESDGDQDKAVQWLREKGAKVQATRSDRETSEGRIGFHLGESGGAMVELLCESAPVTTNDDYLALLGDLTNQLATGPGASTGDELLAQPSPSQDGMTLGQQKDDLFNKIREVFNVNRIARFEGTCAAYVHHTGKDAALIQYEGGDADLAKDIAMHVTATGPRVLNKKDLDPTLVDQERSILTEAARKEGKPENIIEKMVEGRLRNYYAEQVLTEQPFIKDDKNTVGKVAADAGMKILGYVRWQVGKA